MPKRRLLTPGPTQVPEAARLSLAQEAGHHRTPEFVATFAAVLDGLRYVFATQNDCIVLACSGTGAMEAAVVNTVPRGGKAIVLSAGLFAKRWGDIARVFGVDVVEHVVPWGRAIDPSDVARFGTLMESSTGVAHDIEAIGREVRKTSALFVVDGISGAGAIECLTDDWGIDILVVGSQKALMLPPGLGFLSVSEKAWRRIGATPNQSFYFDLQLHRQKLREGPTTPWTPAHTLIGALAHNLRMIRSEGLANILARNRRLAAATRAGMQAIGLSLFAERPADGMTAVRVPAGIDAGFLLKQVEQRFGVKLAGGQGALKGKILRVAHFGQIDDLDLLSAVGALEMVLAEAGRLDELGAGVTAFMQALVEVPVMGTAS